MHLPKMILFDYGHTLVYEPYYDYKKCAKEILRHVTVNPYGIDAGSLSEFRNEIIRDQASILHPKDLEVNGEIVDRLLMDMYDLKFDVSLEELEYETWVACEPVTPMEGITDFLLQCEKKGIRTGIISNIAISGRVLERRTKELFPMHHFEFVLASSDYLYRKPHPHMFQIAMNKARLSAKDIWFCGDNIVMDVEAAAKVGMFPVWYDCELTCTYRDKINREPECEYLHIHTYHELAHALEMV